MTKKAITPISFKIVFQGIPEVCESQTIEMKISRSQNPKEPGLSITYEEYPFPTAEEYGHLVVHYCKKRTESTDDKSSACKEFL